LFKHYVTAVAFSFSFNLVFDLLFYFSLACLLRVSLI